MNHPQWPSFLQHPVFAVQLGLPLLQNQIAGFLQIKLGLVPKQTGSVQLGWPQRLTEPGEPADAPPSPSELISEVQNWTIQRQVFKRLESHDSENPGSCGIAGSCL